VLVSPPVRPVCLLVESVAESVALVEVIASITVLGISAGVVDFWIFLLANVVELSDSASFATPGW